MERSELIKTKQTLATLPLDIFRLITSRISIYDIFTLWLTGVSSFRILIGSYGAIKSVDLEITRASVIRAPFGFFGAFSHLTSFRLSTGIAAKPLFRVDAHYTDLSALPKSLTHLSLQAPNVLELLFDRSKLSIVSTPVRLSAYQLERRPHFSAIRSYKVNNLNGSSRLFYNLNELFPHLDSLELREASVSTMDEDEDRMFGVKSTLPADTCPGHFNRYFLDDRGEEQVYPSLIPPSHYYEQPFESNAEEWLHVQLLKALPKSLSKLVALLAREWEASTLSEYLPSTITDLYVRSMTSSAKFDQGYV